MKADNKPRRLAFSSYLRLAVAFAPALPALMLSAAPAQAAALSDIEAVKKSLLDDPLFLSHLRDKISSDSISTDKIRQYLLAHPEILAEMQQALAAQSAQGGLTSAEQVKLIEANKNLLYHTPNDITLGNKNAKTAILEFYDYNCGYCKRDFAELQKLTAQNPNVKIIMKDYPILGDDSVRAHLIAHAVKQLDPAKYPLFHEKMMTMKGRATEASALAIAQSLGLRESALKTAAVDPAVQENMLAGARIAYQLGLNYTPVFISGTKILGAVDIKNLQQMMAGEEKQAGKAQ